VIVGVYQGERPSEDDVTGRSVVDLHADYSVPDLHVMQPSHDVV